jgi:hypothetical protein
MVGVAVGVQVSPGHPQGVGVEVAVGVMVGVQVNPPAAKQGTTIGFETDPEALQVTASRYP